MTSMTLDWSGGLKKLISLKDFHLKNDFDFIKDVIEWDKLSPLEFD